MPRSTSGWRWRTRELDAAVAAAGDAAACCDHLDRAARHAIAGLRAVRDAVDGPPRRRPCARPRRRRWSLRGVAQPRVRAPRPVRRAGGHRRVHARGARGPPPLAVAVEPADQRRPPGRCGSRGARAAAGPGVRAGGRGVGGVHRRPAPPRGRAGGARRARRRRDRAVRPRRAGHRARAGRLPDARRVPRPRPRPRAPRAVLAHVPGPGAGDEPRADARAVRHAPGDRAAVAGSSRGPRCARRRAPCGRSPPRRRSSTRWPGPSRSAAAAFIDACEAVLADQLRGDSFQPWDQFAGIDALTRAIGADREAVRPYLTVEAVTEGLFRLAREVFGIRVEERPGGMGWHEDVRTLALIDDATGEQLGTCLWDPWDRRGKMAGTVGFMDLLEADAPPPVPTGTCPPAVTMLVTMFARPADGGAAHLGVGDAEVLFHEFGHVLDFTIGSRRSIELADGWWGDGLGRGAVVLDRLLSRAPEVDRDVCAPPRDRRAGAGGARREARAGPGDRGRPYVAKYLQLARVDLAVHGPDDRSTSTRPGGGPPRTACSRPDRRLPAVRPVDDRGRLRRRAVRGRLRARDPRRAAGRVRARRLAVPRDGPGLHPRGARRRARSCRRCSGSRRSWAIRRRAARWSTRLRGGHRGGARRGDRPAEAGTRRLASPNRRTTGTGAAGSAVARNAAATRPPRRPPPRRPGCARPAAGSRAAPGSALRVAFSSFQMPATSPVDEVDRRGDVVAELRPLERRDDPAPVVVRQQRVVVVGEEADADAAARRPR